jgi:hypothetical protein
MIPYQKGSRGPAQYACVGFSGVVAIPPPGRQVTDFSSFQKEKFAAQKNME